MFPGFHDLEWVVHQWLYLYNGDGKHYELHVYTRYIAHDNVAIDLTI